MSDTVNYNLSSFMFRKCLSNCELQNWIGVHYMLFRNIRIFRRFIEFHCLTIEKYRFSSTIHASNFRIWLFWYCGKFNLFFSIQHCLNKCFFIHILKKLKFPDISILFKYPELKISSKNIEFCNWREYNFQRNPVERHEILIQPFQ